MVRRKEVVKDIPNITIGDYVLRVWDDKPDRPHRPPHHDHDHHHGPCDDKPPICPPEKPGRPPHHDHEHHPHRPPHPPVDDCDCDKYVPIGPTFIRQLFED